MFNNQIAMNNKQQFFAAFVLCSLFMGYSQTNLFEGDIAIIGIDTSSEDFMFVTFVPLSAGTQIYFTDEEEYAKEYGKNIHILNTKINEERAKNKILSTQLRQKNSEIYKLITDKYTKNGKN